MMIDIEIPADVVQAAEKVSRFFAERNITDWKLGAVQARDTTPPAQRTYPRIRFHEQGEASEYAILSEDGRWMFAGVRVNGEKTYAAQLAAMRHIVHCWNHRDELVAAIGDLFGAELVKCMNFDGKEDQLAAVERARAAYFNATGEQP